MNNKKIFGILVFILTLAIFVLAFPKSVEAQADQRLHGWNGTDWVSIQTDANGTIKFNANISSISWNNILDLPDP